MKLTRLFAFAVMTLALSSCSMFVAQPVSRSELLTPTAYTALNPNEMTDMKYYGADDTYDYFTRGYSRYKVLRTEKAIPDAARFTFDNWQTSKLYRDCLKETATQSIADKIGNFLQNRVNGAR